MARVPWLRLPVGTGRLLIRRWPGHTGDDGQDPVADLISDAAGVTFRPVRPAEAARAAIALARLDHVRHVVICPVNGAPGQMALALAVGDLLTPPSQRGLPATVTCGTQPPLDGGLITVEHDVVLTAPGGRSDRVVWQIFVTHPGCSGGVL
ncbi:hypothetical protein [Pseudofrankia inefficax]|uniref:hypothetical protein n=1 Tax=Pseudofrankia inefficax (strain DSM 45817 / CECT 9037 / DDB 130130 / EuI1c) TaxID=298654 RepID=UPI0001BFA2F5|nr:hypothetical protein [Pseudofrankia inefficax]